MDKIILIDAYAQIYRCYFAIRQLTNRHGEPVNALYGIARMLLNLSADSEFQGTYGAVVFDCGKCVRRCEILPSYKAQRPPMPEELRDQLGKIRQWIEAFGWPLVSREGFEADDVIAGIAANRGGNQVAILSKDKDLAQLVCEQVTLYSADKAKGWLPLHIGDVQGKFGVSPERLLDYLALIGDSADNIPGVEGVGPKTAAKYINEYGGIDDILSRVGEISNEKMREKLLAAKDVLHRNLSLVRLDEVLPENWNGLDDIRRKAPDWNRIRELAEAENFRSIIDIVNKQEKPAEPEKLATPQQLTFDF